MTRISGKTFTEIYENFAGLSVADTKHLRFEQAKGLYTNDKFCLQWLLDYFQCAAERSAARRRAAGPCIWSAIVQQYDVQVASDIFKDVLSCVDESHEVEISWDSMKQIKEKLEKTPTQPTADPGATGPASGVGQKAGANRDAMPGKAPESDRNAAVLSQPREAPTDPELRRIAESPDALGLENYIRDNLRIDLSIEQLDSVQDSLPADVQRTFRKIMAWCYYKTLAEIDVRESHSPISANQAREQLLRLLEVTEEKQDFTFGTTSCTALESPDELAKKWMLDQIYMSLYCDKVDYDAGFAATRNRGYGEQSLGGYEALYNESSLRKQNWLDAEGVPDDHIAAIAQAIDRKLHE